MSDGNGLAEAMLGLDGMKILEVSEEPDELIITVETTATVVGCGECGTRAEAHDRKPTDVRDLAYFGRPVRLRVLKRRWRCVVPDCAEDVDSTASWVASSACDDLSSWVRGGSSGG